MRRKSGLAWIALLAGAPAVCSAAIESALASSVNRNDAASAAWREGVCPGDPPLAGLLVDPPYLEHASDLTDVSFAVSGGVPPYVCSQFAGPGRGTVPGTVQLTGCTLSGGTDSGDPPGGFGFTVRVTDTCGSFVDVPVAVQGAPCAAGVTLVPPPWPPRVPADPRAGYGWSLSADLDVLASCEWCISFSIATVTPWTVAASLACANPGDLCSDCSGCVSPIDTCPGQVVMNRPITVQPHATLRPYGSPVWLSATFGLVSSGTVCPGDETRNCHVEVLELVPLLAFADDFESGELLHWSAVVDGS